MAGPLRPAPARSVVIAAVAVAAVTSAYAAMTPAACPDAALGLLAVEQRVRQAHGSISQVVLADPGDLTRDVAAPITWWAGAGDGTLSPTVTSLAPGHQAVVYAWRLAGLTLGGAVKASAIAAWLVGISAWAAYFLMVTPDRRLAWLIVAAFACFRMSHYSANVYLGGETLLWAAYPVAVVVNLRAASRLVPRAWAAGGGALALLLIAAKPSAILLTVAMGLWWVVLSSRDRSLLGGLAAWVAGAAVAWLGAGAAGLLPWPWAIAAPAAGYCANDPWAVTAWATGGWLLGLSDLNTALEAVTRSAVGLWPNSWVAVTSILTAILFGGWYVSARSQPASLPGEAADRRRTIALAVVTVTVVAIGLAWLQLRGSCISFEARHQQYGGYLALPLLASSLAGSVRRRGDAARPWALALGLAVVAAPVIYGVGALTHNLLVHLPQGPRTTGSDGLARQWMEPGEHAGRLDQAITRLAPPPAVLATTSQVVALAYPDRRLLIAWGPTVPAALPVEGIAVLLPHSTPRSEVEAKGRFPGVRAWTVHDVGGGARLLVAAVPP